MHRRTEPLSPEVQELLSAEREIVPMPESVRRRAQLRARRAVWHVRHDAGGGFRPVPRFTWARVLLSSVSVASASLATWFAFNDPHQPVEPSVVITTLAAPSAVPVAAGAPASADATPTPVAPAKAEKREPLRSTPQASPAKQKRERSRSTEATAPTDVELLDEARRALGDARYRRALHLLAQHQRRFPNSQLAEERDALRVRALNGAGRADDAERAMNGFEERHPNSVLGSSLARPRREARAP
jgi:hypothetical protein